MAITSAVSNVAKLGFITGSHTPLHTYKIALYQSLAVLDATTTAYTTTQEVTGSGYVAGGQVLTNYTQSLTNGVATVSWNTNPSWPASSFTARGALIYNTSGSAPIATYDFGQEYTATNGTFTVTLPANTSATAIVRLS